MEAIYSSVTFITLLQFTRGMTSYHSIMVITTVRDSSANECIITDKQDQILSEIQNELNEQLNAKT